MSSESNEAGSWTSHRLPWMGYGRGSAGKFFLMVVLTNALLCFVSVAAARSQDLVPWSQQAPELLLSTMIIRGVDTNAALFIAMDAGQQAFVAIEPFAEALGIKATELTNRWQLDTPIGQTQIAASQVRHWDGNAYVSVQLLAKQLASDISFDQSEFAVLVAPAWPESSVLTEQPTIQPSGGQQQLLDARAPRLSLSEVRSEFLYRYQDNRDTLNNVTDFGGRLGAGYWRLRYNDDFEGTERFEDYTWLNTGRQHRLLLGNQSVSLSSLLSGFDFTGAQAAWTNRPEAVFRDNLQASMLLGISSGSIRTFRGDGPPGGIAELRVDNVVESRMIVGLDGRYEFRDFELRSGGPLQIEVWLFDRGVMDSPSKIDDFSRYNSVRLLPQGAITHYGGAGVTGNWLEDPAQFRQDTAFYQMRYAPLEDLTLQLGLQTTDGNLQSSVSALSNFRYLGFVGAELATNDQSERAWRLELDNEFGSWFWRGNFLHRDDQFRPRQTELDDRYFEAGYLRADRGLRLSLVARNISSDERSVDYVKPALSWRVRHNLSLSARPDISGDYTGSARWRIDRRDDLAAYYQPDSRSLQWTRQLGRQHQLVSTVVDRDQTGLSESVIMRHHYTGSGRPGWALGALHTRGRAGFLAQLDYELIPGLRARAEALRDPARTSGLGDTDTVFSVNLIADFALSRSGLVRGQYRSRLHNTGSIAGRIRLPATAESVDLAGVGVLINGQSRGMVEPDGAFLVSRLRPGVYRVRLDAGELPLEVHTTNQTYLAEVESGSVTTVDFEVEVRFGFAGRVQLAGGSVVGGADLQLYSASNEKVGAARSNQFGLYRIDQVPSGDYELRVISSAGEVIARRPIQIENDFLFGQDVLVQSETERPLEDGNDE